jgi:type II secretory pathway pseudopilin PulG
MKKAVFGLGLAIVILAVVAGGLWSVRRKIQREHQLAIVAVLEEARQDAVQVRKSRDGQVINVHADSLLFSAREYLGRLRGISTAQCPGPFRAAWLDLIQAEESYRAPLAGIEPMVDFAISTVPRSGGEKADEVAPPEELDPKEAWARLQIAALSYGVRIH